MPDLQISDPDLGGSPEGRFLIAIGKAILGLDIDPLKLLAIDAYPIIMDAPLPAIVIAPVLETLPRDGKMGVYEVDFMASVAMTTHAVGGDEPSLGWQLQTRNRLLERFSGMTSETAHLNEGGDCFNISVKPGVRFDDRARKSGWLLSRFFVTGSHSNV